MKRFVIAYDDGNDTCMYDVVSDTWQQAIKTAVLIHHNEPADYIKDWVSDMPNDEEEVKQYFYDCDSSIAWLDIT